MPKWIEDVQGYREILGPTGVAVQRRKALQIIGATVSDNGSWTEITVPAGATGATGPTPSASDLRGVGLTVSASKLATRLRPRKLELFDPFVLGGTASAQIGLLGWNLLGVGTPTFSITTGSLETSTGLLSTSGATADTAILNLRDTTSSVWTKASEIDLVQAVVRLGGTLSTKRVFFGLSSDLATEPASMANGIGFFYDSAVSANWRAICRSGSVGAAVDSALAVPSDTLQLLSIHQPTPGTFAFWIGSNLVASINANVPTANMALGFRLETLANSSAAVRLNKFVLNANVGAVSASDSQFEA